MRVNKSSVSREFIERSEMVHDVLMARKFDDIGGGAKHMLGITGVGSENAEAVTVLLRDILARGVNRT